MQTVNVNAECDVPKEAKLVGFIFETKEEVIFNFHEAEWLQ